MNRTLKFSIALSLILLLLVGLFLGIGFFQNPKFEGTKSEAIGASKEEIWKYITDINDLPNRRKEVLKVEVLEKDDTTIPKLWKEHTDMGGYMTFERGETIPNKKIEIILADSSFKMRGSWTYEISEANGYSKLSITERSEINSPVVRGAYFLAGRDSTLKQELEMVRNHFQSGK
ncbi:polyketide cyclase [Leptospira kobayashii]|uniref:Polyketide cyclase n=1 Tax=Leptospira kobayashii TaxID=1917830 RepID=A0ABM7UNF1_9LEPT|nr:SRPBCC family protein [Leptospira kobayashii]BDA80518.1 polyketide cyclase [Leptospira kobayashii]